jgi:dTDP-4-amino-4,6-dideoxygalactose transaminase
LGLRERQLAAAGDGPQGLDASASAGRLGLSWCGAGRWLGVRERELAAAGSSLCRPAAGRRLDVPRRQLAPARVSAVESSCSFALREAGPTSPAVGSGCATARSSRLVIPLSRPWIDTAEVEAAAEAVRRHCLAGLGAETLALEDAVARALDGTRMLFMTSCTSALEAAVRLAGIGPGDEVITPSFTFVSTANAVVLAGGRPVFVDIDPVDLNLDPDACARAITPRTRAIIVVHYGGRACAMDRFLALAERHGLQIIEDAAHGFGGRWRGRLLGTIGDFGCYSFHGTKDLVCGEGGGLVCREVANFRRAEIFREKGTNRTQFLRGEVDRYTWVDQGSSWVASDVLAAILRVQIGRLADILARKRRLAERLGAQLGPVADRVRLPHTWPEIESTWHLYPVLVDPAIRDQAIAALRAEGVGAAFHYVPLHSSPYGRSRLGYEPSDLPNTERVSASLVRLPLFGSMTDAELDAVGGAALKVFEQLVPATVRP